EGDQALGEAQRHQPLGGSARYLQHLCDLVLRVARDEVKPTVARGVVKAGFLAVQCCHEDPSSLLPEVRHPVKHTIRTGVEQHATPVAKPVVAAADKSPR